MQTQHKLCAQERYKWKWAILSVFIARAIYFQKMHSWTFFVQNKQIYGVKHSGYSPLPLDIRVQFEWPMLFLTFGI